MPWSQVDMASWATERGRGAELGSPPLPNALDDPLIHHHNVISGPIEPNW
jgi:hypothetical protein